MSISMQKLLLKMEEEIKNARASSTETRIRERIQAIKTLCELILEEPETKEQKFGIVTKQASTVNLIPTANLSPASNSIPTANQVPAANSIQIANSIPSANPARNPIPAVISQPQRLHIDDDANGESLLDF